MEKNFTIGIAKKAIFEKTQLFTSYIGVKCGGDNEDFDRVSAIEEDDEMLSELLEEAVTQLAVILGERISGWRALDKKGMPAENAQEAAEYEVTLKTVMNAATAKSMLRVYLAEEVARRWLLIVGENVIAKEIEEMQQLKIERFDSVLPVVTSGEGRKAKARKISPV